MGIRDDQLDALEAALDQALQEGRPEGLGFRWTDTEANNLPPAIGVGGDGDYGRHRDDAAALADLEVGGVEPQVGPFALERAIEEGTNPFVDLLAQFGDLALRDAGEPIACTSSSTRRVETPPIQASWMTATKAFSVVRRASRKGGK